MLEDYKNALKSGQRAYRACVARGQSPYLAVLDDILVNVNIVSQEPLGLVEIPAESIVGTKTSGRHTAFAPNFMPLLEADTEFATKWSNLCEAHLEEGIHTPIIAFEFMNRFYVQEGNKRVSVLKYYGAVKIAGTVTRLIPARNDSLENRIYYEFLDFYKLSQINYVHFSRTGGYAKLQTLVCKASGESWTEDDRLNFSSFYTVFRQQFIALGGHDLKLTTGDGLLVYLSVYRYADACEATPAQVKENLEKLWTEVKVLTEPQAVELSLEPAPSAGEPLLSKLNIFSSKPSELKVAFLHENNAENSAWVRNHNKGRDALEQAFPDRLTTTTLENVNPEVDAEQALEELAHDSVDVVFTTSARMHTACLKVAAQHPKIRILNCSPAGPAGWCPDPHRPGGLCGPPPGVRCAGGPQRLCPGLKDRAAPGPGGAAVVLPAGPGKAAGFFGLPGCGHLLCTQPKGAGGLLPGLRPVPQAAGRHPGPPGPAGVEVGGFLYRDHPFHLRRHLGQLRCPGYQLLVGDAERCGGDQLPEGPAWRHPASAGYDGDAAEPGGTADLPG